MQNPPVPGGGMGYPPAGGPPTGAAKDQVNVPAILLIVTGAIGVLFALYGMISGGASPADLSQIPEEYRQYVEMSQKGGPFLNLIPLVLSGLVIFGALKMKNLQSYGLAMTSAIIAMIPCFGPCCCIGIPVGIWALVVLNKPEVKAAFTK